MAQAREPHRECGGEARPSTDRAERSGGHGSEQGQPDATRARPHAGGLALSPRSSRARLDPRARLLELLEVLSVVLGHRPRVLLDRERPAAGARAPALPAGVVEPAEELGPAEAPGE